jgi:hypothetical protein
MDSSKIKKQIKSVTFSGKKVKWTTIKFGQTFTPVGQNDSIEEQPTFKSNMSRHPDFNRAMEIFKAHLLIRCGFAEPLDRIGQPITADYFLDHIYEDDHRFEGVEITGVIITTKKDNTGFQIIGTHTTQDGQVVKLKSPAISTLKKAEGEGYNYPLIAFVDEQLDTLIIEAENYLKYKSDNPQLKLAV